MATPKVDIWMPIYIGDYLRDTQDLTAEEHGAYFLLLMYYWQKKGAIGADIKRLSIVAKASHDITKSVLTLFFTLENGSYKNKRSDKELQFAQSRSNSARANINKRWNKDSNTAVDTPVIPPYNDGNTAEYTAGGTEQHTELIPDGYSSPSSSSSPAPSQAQSPKKEERPVLKAPIPLQSKSDGCSRIETARAYWNELKPGPECRLSAIQFKPDDSSDCLRIMSVYSDTEIAEAIQNYTAILQSSEHEVKSRYQSFVGFIRGGVEKFIGSADPWTAYKKRDKGFETAAEREAREHAEASEFIMGTEAMA